MVRQTDSKIESLVLRLRKEEKWSIGQIAAHVKMSKGGIHKIIHREKSKKTLRKVVVHVLRISGNIPLILFFLIFNLNNINVNVNFNV